MNIKFLLFAILLTSIACQAQEAESNANSDTAVAPAAEVIVPDSYDCKLHGLQLKEEMHWMAEKQMLFAVAAQGEDINGSAPKYRTFQVYTTQDCNMISYTLMPNNPDNKPYRLFPNTYDPVNEVVCAQGYDFTFCYHVRRKEFLLPLIPKYISTRLKNGDAGTPQGLATWGTFVFGNATQLGAFAYDLKERSNPKSTLPKLEYIDRSSRTYKQLFLLRGEDGQQVIIPQSENGQLNLHPLLKAGEEISANMVQDPQTGRFAIARTKGEEQAIVFDLQTAKRLDLPRRLTETRDILDYLKQEYK